MAVIRITKEFTFEAAHVLEGYDGACSQIHGHSYRLFVTVLGTPVSETADPKNGMVMDFGVLKGIVNSTIVGMYDHALVIKQGAAGNLAEVLKERFDRIITTPFQPTCENMLADFAQRLVPLMPAGVSLYSLRLHETATSYAEWFAEDNY